MKSSKNYNLEEFHCRRCGSCCKGDGIVNLSDAEIGAAARLLNLSRDEFLKQFTTETEWGERWLIDKFVDDQRWCVFLERDGNGLHSCRIQQAKPEQCVGFPYTWRSHENVQSCEGLR